MKITFASSRATNRVFQSRFFYNPLNISGISFDQTVKTNSGPNVLRTKRQTRICQIKKRFYLQVIFWQVLALFGQVDPVVHVTHHCEDTKNRTWKCKLKSFFSKARTLNQTIILHFAEMNQAKLNKARRLLCISVTRCRMFYKNSPNFYINSSINKFRTKMQLN